MWFVPYERIVKFVGEESLKFWINKKYKTISASEIR